MNVPDSLPPETGAEQALMLREVLRKVERRQWWMWSTAVMVTILLTVGIASFAFPGLLDDGADDSYSFGLNQAVRALVGLVLLFTVYTIYQQLQIRRMQAALSDQLLTLDKMRARTEEIYKMALLDPLTGLYNRRCGEQRLATEMARSQRSGAPLEVVMLDLDDLKCVNDQLGHAAGDELLKYFSLRLNKAIRGSDLAVRLGGDEFMLVLPECRPEEARFVLGRLNNMTTEIGGREITVTFSAGCADYLPGETPLELMKRADQDLYVNKRAAKQQREVSSAPIA